MRLALFAAFLLAAFPVFSQRYEASWESLDKRPTPGWWTDAKFGIFIHWGVYSVPAYAPTGDDLKVYARYSEHYFNRLLQGEENFTAFHNKFYGKDFSYRDFAPMFRAEYFEPSSWAELFREAGARYVVLTSKHHDGFCLWPSKYSRKGWNSVDTGPRRDLAGDLAEAVREEGLHMGFYYSLLEWDNPLYSKATIGRWVDEHMIPQMKELVTEYRPEVIFSDGEWDYPSKTLKSEEFLAWLYNESPVKDNVVVNDRWGSETRSLHGGYYTTEYDLIHDKTGIGDKAVHPWEECRGIGTSFGYNRFETLEDYSSSEELVHLLIDKVSNGGNLLLNVGPAANGLIPVIMQERLLDMGSWLRVNGEAIYGTSTWSGRPSGAAAENLRFTVKDGTLYVICLEWPAGELNIRGLEKAGEVSMLGTDAGVSSSFSRGVLTIRPPDLLPGRLPCSYAWVFKVDNAF